MDQNDLGYSTWLLKRVSWQIKVSDHTSKLLTAQHQKGYSKVILTLESRLVNIASSPEVFQEKINATLSGL